MIVLTLLALVLYGLFGIVRMPFLPLSTRRIIRWGIGIVFAILTVIYAYPFETLDHYLLVLVMLSIISSVEIAHFKVAKGDQDRVFLVHSFSVLLMVGYVILMFVL